MAGVAVRVTLLLAIFAGAVFGQESSSPALANSIIQKMEQAQANTHAVWPYQVLREYQLYAGRSSTSDSTVVVQLQFRPPSKKDYAIEKTAGNARGVNVVRKILDREVEQSAEKPSQSATLTSDNYDFAYLGESAVDGQPCYRVALKPKRKATDLIAGEALVDQRSFLVRQINGTLAKSPSWWLKDVHVKISFADMQGTWLQTGVEAIADVRFMGEHKLTSRTLEYHAADEVAANMSGSSSSTHTKTPTLAQKAR